MAKYRSSLYRLLAVMVAWCGVLSACVCATGHGPSVSPATACHRCADASPEAVGAQWTSHHQCCGMQRAPMAVERLASSDPVLSTGVALSLVRLVSQSRDYLMTLSGMSHAPPGDIPIYLTTQHFVI